MSEKKFDLLQSIGNESGIYQHIAGYKMLPLLKHVVFWDIDNFPVLLKVIPGPIPDSTLICGFYGGSTVWNESKQNNFFFDANKRGCIHICRKNLPVKNSADFNLSLAVGELNTLLPRSIRFTVLSNDKGFLEIGKAFEQRKRSVHVVAPNTCKENEVYELITRSSDE